MLERTKEYIAVNKLFNESDTLLLAISGGIDSMVMLDLFCRLSYPISVAHCNFALRGKESDADQELVRTYCAVKGLDFFAKKFDTAGYAKKNATSIQMAARDLRYEWFEELRVEHKFDSVVLAHNKDDLIETFLLNLSRGTGIKGLTGIKARNSYLARPLLFASRDDIIKYSEENNIVFREDSSNKETKYRRNAIRHKIIPLFKELNPSFIMSIDSTIRKLEETERLASAYLESISERVFVSDKDQIKVKIKDLEALDPLNIHLYELFKDFGIGQSNLEELKKLMSAPTGKYLETNSCRISVDRDYLLISSSESSEPRELSIGSFDDLKAFNAEILAADTVEISGRHDTAYLDYDKIVFPVSIRSWKKGDWFHPFGMEGRKKISDFFTDQKVSLARKEKIMLFLSEGNIFWVAGYRIDRRYAVGPETRRVLKLSLGP